MCFKQVIMTYWQDFGSPECGGSYSKQIPQTMSSSLPKCWPVTSTSWVRFFPRLADLGFEFVFDDGDDVDVGGAGADIGGVIVDDAKDSRRSMPLLNESNS